MQLCGIQAKVVDWDYMRQCKSEKDDCMTAVVFFFQQWQRSASTMVGLGARHCTKNPCIFRLYISVGHPSSTQWLLAAAYASSIAQF